MSDVLGFDPERVTIGEHARQRYLQRRRTKPEFVDQGIRRLLSRAAASGIEPVQVDRGRRARHYCVGQFRLLISEDHDFLFTILVDARRRSWKNPKTARRGRRRVDDE